jgi:hypothetical protein
MKICRMLRFAETIYAQTQTLNLERTRVCTVRIKRCQEGCLGIKPLRAEDEPANEYDPIFVKQLAISGSAFEADDGCVGIVVAENLLEISVFFRHGPGSRLAEPDAVSLSDPIKNDLIAFVSPGEAIAENGAPA